MFRNAIFAPTSALFVLLANTAISAPISVDAFGNSFEVYHFRDFRGPNSVGLTEGDRQPFGAVNVVPNGKGEDDGVPVSTFNTTGVARQGQVEVPLFAINGTLDPNLFANAVDYDEALTSSWELEFTNGADTLVVNTPALGVTTSLPIVNSLRYVSGDPTTPTFEWEDPGDVDEVRVSIYDLNRVQQNSVLADRIFSSSALNNSFTIPDGVLEADGRYAFSVEARISRTSGTNPSGSSQVGSALCQSRTFFEFQTGLTPLPAGAYLPQVSVSSGTPIFNFNNPVVANMIEYYDPFVAIGYDYKIGAGDPNFASFILPELGDNVYDLYLFDDVTSAFVFEATVGATSEYFFGGQGVDLFRILGVETELGIDPIDATAFVSGLSFVDDGRFTGTMTPISTFIADPSPVPLPATLPMLLFSSLAVFGVTRRRKSRNLHS